MEPDPVDAVGELPHQQLLLVRGSEPLFVRQVSLGGLFVLVMFVNVRV